MQPMKLRVLSKRYLEEDNDGDGTSSVSYFVRVGLAQQHPHSLSRNFVELSVDEAFFDSIDVGDQYELAFAPPQIPAVVDPEPQPELELAHQEAPSEAPPAS